LGRVGTYRLDNAVFLYRTMTAVNFPVLRQAIVGIVEHGGVDSMFGEEGCVCVCDEVTMIHYMKIDATVGMHARQTCDRIWFTQTLRPSSARGTKSRARVVAELQTS
jgi:hypothetical protein